MLDAKGLSLETFLQKAMEHNAEILQYRAKNADIAFIKQQLITIRKVYDGFLIVNDAYELVEFCDGVHVGQEDLCEIDEDVHKAVNILRSVIGSDKILGISTHNEEEVLQANTMDVNYIGLGAYRNTVTKQDIVNVLGKELDAIAKLSKHYVAAIGGVRLDDKFENVTYHVIGSGLL
ncbi:Thiamin-phosphate pyrophosphorylase [hydrothermal vent metagenome]|uniref:Thiamin-phosphate pyrophosphorylase n=1 Tax=hydrothermal vent metagenome TaxID=652676 RepID=A0A1W1BHV3_9ZZZZ